MLALPHLEIMAAPGGSAAPAESAVPMRMVCVGTSFGFVPHLFFPQQTGEGYETPLLLKPLEKHRRNFTVFSQLDHGAEAVGGHTGVHAFLSGILSKHARGFKEGNVSVDQKAAAHAGAATRYPSMQFTSGAGSNNQLSWTTSGVAIPPLEDPAMLHALLFQKSGPRKRSVLRRLNDEQRSILDLVRTDVDHLRKRVGREDQEKLDQYFTSVREVEKRLAQSARWLQLPKPQDVKPQWVEARFAETKQVRHVGVFWMQDQFDVKFPAESSLEVEQEGKWKPFELYTTDRYDTRANQYNVVHPAAPLKCEAIRIRMTPQENACVGILEVQVAFEQ